MSHTKHIATIQQITRNKVLAALGWDDLRYGAFIMARADAYLQYHIGADVDGVQLIKETTGFWAWWRNHWHRRDMLFLDEIKHLAPAEKVLYYEITHNAEAIEFTPHHLVMADSFATDVINPLCGRAKVERKVRI